MIDFTPRPYQRLMIDWIIERQRCALWAEMGTGKTVSAYSAMDMLWLAGSHFHPALVIAPLRVARGVWPREQQKWRDFKGMRVSSITGTAEDRFAALRASADVYTINFENIEWLFDQLKSLKAWPFKIVIVDEATRLKGFRLRNSTKRANALAAICARVGRWINLTGTPASNGYIDLWGQMYFIDMGQRLGASFTEFKQRWFDENEYSREVTMKPFAMDEINKLVGDVCLTIRAGDWFDLREPIISKIEVEMPAKLMRTYRELKKEMYAELDSNTALNPVNAAACSSKCLQFASGAVLLEDKSYREVHDAKLDALDSIVHETNGAPLMVGYWWRHDGDRLKKRFPFARFIKTQKDEDDWNAGKIPMILTQYQSIGHGVELQHGGHRLVHFSRWWDLEVDEQLRARLGPVRQFQAGYNRPVYEYNLVTVGTADEDVTCRHESKRAVQDILLDATRRFK